MLSKGLFPWFLSVENSLVEYFLNLAGPIWPLVLLLDTAVTPSRLL